MKNQNRKVFAALSGLALLVALLLVFSATPASPLRAQGVGTLTATVAPTNTATVTPTIVSTPFPVVANNGVGAFFLCSQSRFPTPAPGDCFQSNGGGSIHMYDNSGNQTFSVDGSTGNVSLAGTFAGANGNKVMQNAFVTVTAANIHAGTTLITVPAGRQFRLISARAVAIGATCTTSTAVTIVSGANTLVSFATASLTRSTILTDAAAGGTVLADGASFLDQTAGTAVTVADTVATTAGCTSVQFSINYVLD